MFRLIKILSGLVCSFFREQRMLEGIAIIPKGVAKTLQGLPTRFRGAAVILVGHGCVPTGQPHNLAGAAQVLHGLLPSIFGMHSGIFAVLRSVEVKYINSHGAPALHIPIP